MGLYEICLAAGVILAMVVFRVLAEKREFSAAIQNFILIDTFVSVVGGYISAVLFQAFYNYLDSGVFEIKNDTGATFLGGLIGGAGIFLLIYFFIGKLIFKKKENIKCFSDLLCIAGASVAAAHGIGRLGCFFAGCCYGLKTDGAFGIYMVNPGYSVIPVQLYECIFLLLLSAVIFVLTYKKQNFKIGLPVYMLAYGIWRFFIEYLRGDDRGAFFVSFLTPSQFSSLLLIAGGIVLLVFLIKKYGKKE